MEDLVNISKLHELPDADLRLLIDAGLRTQLTRRVEESSSGNELYATVVAAMREDARTFAETMSGQGLEPDTEIHRSGDVVIQPRSRWGVPRTIREWLPQNAWIVSTGTHPYGSSEEWQRYTPARGSGIYRGGLAIVSDGTIYRFRNGHRLYRSLQQVADEDLYPRSAIGADGKTYNQDAYLAWRGDLEKAAEKCATKPATGQKG